MANVNYSQLETPVTYTFKHLLDVSIDDRQTDRLQTKIKTEIIYKYTGYLSSE